MTDNNALELEGIDVSTGLHYTGTMEVYKSLLAEFYDTVEPRCKLLRSSCDSDDLPAFRREVHTLKSQALTIGAAKLSFLAQNLENAADDEDAKFVRENTPSLIDEYEKIGKVLTPYKSAPLESGNRCANHSELVELCARLLTALDDFDIDRAAELTRTFYDYSVPEKAAVKRRALKHSIENFRYEQAIDITRELMTEV